MPCLKEKNADMLATVSAGRAAGAGGGVGGGAPAVDANVEFAAAAEALDGFGAGEASDGGDTAYGVNW